jgi:hypothetical protein
MPPQIFARLLAPLLARRANQLSHFAPDAASLASPQALEIAVRKRRIAETIQSELGRPVPHAEIFHLPRQANHLYRLAPPASLENSERPMRSIFKPNQPH